MHEEISFLITEKRKNSLCVNACFYYRAFFIGIAFIAFIISESFGHMFHSPNLCTRSD